MRRTTQAVMGMSLMCALAMQANAQPPERTRPGPPGPGGRPMFPLMQALDADRDGELSQKEIENATAALKELDRNEDGKLTGDELRPNFPGFGGPREGRPDGDRRREGDRGPEGERRRDGDRRPEGDRRPDGERRAEGDRRPDGERRPQGPFGGSPADMVARIMERDANKDGKLTKDEVPERMQDFLFRADDDKDGSLTKDELTKRAERSRGFGGPGFGPGRPGGPGFGFGPPSPERIVERAMQFDDDNDGKLNREELRKFAEQFARGPGGPGAERGDRPQRPDRPEEKEEKKEKEDKDDK